MYIFYGFFLLGMWCSSGQTPFPAQVSLAVRPGVLHLSLPSTGPQQMTVAKVVGIRPEIGGLSVQILTLTVSVVVSLG